MFFMFRTSSTRQTADELCGIVAPGAAQLLAEGTELCKVPVRRLIAQTHHESAAEAVGELFVAESAAVRRKAALDQIGDAVLREGSGVEGFDERGEGGEVDQEIRVGIAVGVSAGHDLQEAEHAVARLFAVEFIVRAFQRDRGEGDDMETPRAEDPARSAEAGVQTLEDRLHVRGVGGIAADEVIVQLLTVGAEDRGRGRGGDGDGEVQLAEDPETVGGRTLQDERAGAAVGGQVSGGADGGKGGAAQGCQEVRGLPAAVAVFGVGSEAAGDHAGQGDEVRLLGNRFGQSLNIGGEGGVFGFVHGGFVPFCMYCLQKNSYAGVARIAQTIHGKRIPDPDKWGLARCPDLRYNDPAEVFCCAGGYAPVQACRSGRSHTPFFIHCFMQFKYSKTHITCQAFERTILTILTHINIMFGHES